MQLIRMPAAQLDYFFKTPSSANTWCNNRCANTTEYLHFLKGERRGERRNAQQRARQGTVTYRSLGQILLPTDGCKPRVTQDTEKACARIDGMGGVRCLAPCVFPAEYIFAWLLRISSGGGSSPSAGGFAKAGGGVVFTLRVSKRAAAERPAIPCLHLPEQRLQEAAAAAVQKRTSRAQLGLLLGGVSDASCGE